MVKKGNEMFKGYAQRWREVATLGRDGSEEWKDCSRDNSNKDKQALNSCIQKKRGRNKCSHISIKSPQPLPTSSHLQSISSGNLSTSMPTTLLTKKGLPTTTTASFTLPIHPNNPLGVLQPDNAQRRGI
ncbi:hypothetical protein CR513_15874, partial [Mucuna pruriens]